MTPERIAGLLDTFQAAVTDMIEARAVGDAEDEFSRVNTLRMGFLMQMQPLLSAADENAKLRSQRDALVTVLEEVWKSIPATFDKEDGLVRRHARALNSIPGLLRRVREEASDGK